MNQCIFMGRMVHDPEARQANDMTVTRFRLAVKRKFSKGLEQDSDFLNMVAFGKSAESIAQYFDKGSPILVTTHVQISPYKNKEGKMVYPTEFIVDSWEFCGGKSEAEPEKPKAKDGEFVNVPEAINEELPWD